jgi:hypothetical protein
LPGIHVLFLYSMGSFVITCTSTVYL